MAWKVISGALTIIGVLTGLWTIHEARSGIAHTRGGTILRADSPQTFLVSHHHRCPLDRTLLFRRDKSVENGPAGTQRLSVGFPPKTGI